MTRKVSTCLLHSSYLRTLQYVHTALLFYLHRTAYSTVLALSLVTTQQISTCIRCEAV